MLTTNALFTVTAIVGIILLVYRYITGKSKFFEDRDIPYEKPTFLLGSHGPILLKKRDLYQQIKHLYDAFPKSKIVGGFDFINPVWIVRDPELIKRIGVKDFDHFVDRMPVFTHPDEEVDRERLIENILLALRGQKWRDMRATLSPAFTGSKMRHMFGLVVKCAESTATFYAAEAKAGRKLELEMKEVFSRLCNDMIASVAFGIQVDSFREPLNDFYVMGKELLNFKKVTTIPKVLMFRGTPWLARRLKLDLFNSTLLAYFKRMITDNMEQRVKNGIVRNDMIHMLMQVRKGALKHSLEEADTKDAGFATVEESNVGKSTQNREWSDNELIAQCFLFFLGGFETMSTFLQFLSYELLANPDIQQRLYEEILVTEAALNGKPLSYDVLQKMQYMDMVVSEALRLWPPAAFIDRFCVKSYTFESDEGKEIKIDRGQIVWFPVVALHHDPQYFPEPHKFNPERFSEANRSSINTATYLPFGIGPRNCIGSRLALMEVKAIVYSLLKNFTLEATSKSQIPLRLMKTILGPIPESGVWLELKPRM
ncbi:probable cytochrome P450 9f2 isoform X2 [Topomyia yanbarensis]|uniref:probable cytochrome P450 9f2 isoform X2 n=1 Tax=Topomyia yanbarensis TaxID=2498891 RepID=UPI00273C88F9|nr:probable cytochrome P450 9f2 isoform X2 [Topomyia yanbarensis]XP_058837421.1 probable cytochrome P450 9f2 isoform X2 [Topomyia yanbarensis]